VAIDRAEVLRRVEERVLAIPGVVAMRYLDPELKEEVTRLELLAEKNGACMGMMPFVNEGVWEALARDVSFMIVGNAHLIVDNEGLLYMKDAKGQVIGEYVPPHLKEAFLREHPDANFLSEDFVLHSGVEVEGEPYFLINEVAFRYLDGIPGISRVTSGSVSTMSDDLVRSVTGHVGEKQWTHLVGFDLSLD